MHFWLSNHLVNDFRARNVRPFRCDATRAAVADALTALNAGAPGLDAAQALATTLNQRADATNRLPRARPISVSPALRASSTPQAVNPERDTRMGMCIFTHLITISEVSRPVV